MYGPVNERWRPDRYRPGPPSKYVENLPAGSHARKVPHAADRGCGDAPWPGRPARAPTPLAARSACVTDGRSAILALEPGWGFRPERRAHRAGTSPGSATRASRPPRLSRAAGPRGSGAPPPPKVQATGPARPPECARRRGGRSATSLGTPRSRRSATVCAPRAWNRPVRAPFRIPRIAAPGMPRSSRSAAAERPAAEGGTSRGRRICAHSCWLDGSHAPARNIGTGARFATSSDAFSTSVAVGMPRSRASARSRPRSFLASGSRPARALSSRASLCAASDGAARHRRSGPMDTDHQGDVGPSLRVRSRRVAPRASDTATISAAGALPPATRAASRAPDPTPDPFPRSPRGRSSRPGSCPEVTGS